MTKKVLCAAICALLMLMSGAGALADEGLGMVVQSSCNIVPGSEYDLVYTFAQVHNQSSQTICLDTGEYHLADGEQLLLSGDVSRLWPNTLAPGADGYLFDVIVYEREAGDTAAPNITNLSYNLNFMTLDEAYAGRALNTQARLETAQDGESITVVCAVENATDADVFDPMIAFGLYIEGGQMVYAGGTTLENVGIPAGDTVLMRFDVEPEIVEQWRGYGAMPTAVQASALYHVDVD